MARQKKDHPRNEPLFVAITSQDREALNREARRRNKPVSTVAYEMMQRGSLQSLVRDLVASQSAKLPNDPE